MKYLNIIISLMIVALSVSAQEDNYEASTKTQLNQQAPNIEVTTISGEKFSLDEQKGKVVLINFFATWCGPCNAELPVLQNEIWSKYKSQDFILLSIGRGHNTEELKTWSKEKGFVIPMAADPEKENYNKYASMYIPRNILIDKDGKIVYQVVGFKKEDIITLIEKHL